MPFEQEQKLIESIYDVTIDPDKYDDLLSAWGNEFVELSLDDEMNFGPYVSDGRVKVSTNIEGHVKRAFAILEMTNSQANVIPTIKQMIDADPLPTFLLSPTKQILLANDAAVAFFGLEIGRKLSGNSEVVPNNETVT